MIKRKLKFTIITTASNNIGYGHLKRCLNLGAFLRRKKNSVKMKIFTDKINSSRIYKFNFLSNGPSVLKESIFKFSDVVIFDISNKIVFSNKRFVNYLSYISQKYKEKILVIDGLGREMANNNPNFNFSTLICPYFISSKKHIIKRKKVNYLVGPKFSILPSVYKNTKLSDFFSPYKTILVSCGGADKQKNSIKILNFLSQLKVQLRVIVVAGPFFKKDLFQEIKKFKKTKYLKIYLFKNLNNLSKQISKSQLSIISSGLTKYETASVGLPSIIFCENQNQLELHNGFKKEKISINVGLIKNLKKFDNIILNYINNPKKLIFLSQQSKKKVDFNGPNRILNYIRQKY